MFCFSYRKFKLFMPWHVGLKFDMTKGVPNSKRLLSIESTFYGCAAHTSINNFLFLCFFCLEFSDVSC